MKKIIAVLIVLLVCLTGQKTGLASDLPWEIQKPIAVYIDNDKINFFDAKPFINSENRTMIPVRFVSEALGAKVVWEEADKQVLIELDGKVISLKIGEKLFKVNNDYLEMDTTAAIIAQRTLVPLRFILEALGVQLDWDSVQREVRIISKTRTAGSQPAVIPNSETAKKILELVNLERRKAGVPLLKWDDRAARAAYSHAQDMGDNNFFAHISSNTGSPRERLRKAFAGEYITCSGENIAANQRTPEYLVESWMNSEGHRENMLNPDYTLAGAGMYKADSADYEIYYVIDFVGQ